MDIIKEFEAYLPKWAEEHGQPVPPMDQPERWTVAWKDFMREVMQPKRDEVIESYKSMTFKTVGMARREKEIAKREQERAEQIKQVEDVSKVEEKPLSEWEKVKKLMEDS